MITDRQEILLWLEENCAGPNLNPEFNDDNSINLDSHVQVKPEVARIEINFRRVTGDFYCGGELTSLVGCPRRVDGDLNVTNTRITSLEGAPEIVTNIYANHCRLLTTLRGAPKQCNILSIMGSFFCTDLQNLPKLSRLSVSYSKKLPILQILKNKPGYVEMWGTTGEFLRARAIYRKYCSAGHRGIIACASELIAAGLSDNAKF